LLLFINVGSICGGFYRSSVLLNEVPSLSNSIRRKDGIPFEAEEALFREAKAQSPMSTSKFDKRWRRSTKGHFGTSLPWVSMVSHQALLG